MRTGADKFFFWVSLSWLTSGGHLADRCGQLDIWRTLASLWPSILKLCVLYEDEDGWFDRTITWYNTQLGKLRVVFEDDSDDYILPEDINGVDVFLKT